MNRSMLRAGITLVCALLAFLFVGHSILRAVDATGADIGSPSIDLALELRAKVLNIETLRSRSDEPIVVVLGDSTVLNDYKRLEVRKDVGRALARRLGDLTPRPRVRTVATPGLSPASAYWLAPAILETRPAAVLIPANLALLSDWWQYPVPELVRWYPAEHFWQPLVLPIYADGLSADSYLVRWLGAKLLSFEHEKQFSHWRARIRRSRIALERNWLGTRAVEGALMSQRQTRRTHFQGEERYSGALRGVSADHPQLRMLSALVSEFVEAGVPVIVYVPPVSTGYFKDGRNLEGRFARSLDAVREAAARATFLDLHAALPESAFRDWQDHYTTDGDESGMDQLAAILETPVRSALASDD